jgi:hypothetical protein
MSRDILEIDLSIALKKLHQLQLEDGDLGAEYWLSIANLLKDAAQYKERALLAEDGLRSVKAALCAFEQLTAC